MDPINGRVLKAKAISFGLVLITHSYSRPVTASFLTLFLVRLIAKRVHFWQQHLASAQTC